MRKILFILLTLCCVSVFGQWGYPHYYGGYVVAHRTYVRSVPTRPSNYVHVKTKNKRVTIINNYHSNNTDERPITIEQRSGCNNKNHYVEPQIVEVVKEVPQEPTVVQQYVFECPKITLWFECDNYMVGNNYHRVNLINILDFYKAHPSALFRITGYASRCGNYQYNLQLSAKRAHAVKNYLVSMGVCESNFDVKVMGTNDPQYVDDKLNQCVVVEFLGF